MVKNGCQMFMSWTQVTSFLCSFEVFFLLSFFFLFFFFLRYLKKAGNSVLILELHSPCIAMVVNNRFAPVRMPLLTFDWN